MRTLKRILVLWIGIVFVINAFLLPFQAMAFDSEFYITSFIDLKVPETIGISEESLRRVTENLVHYIDTGTGDLKLIETVNGNDVVFYNEKEQHHLNDILLLVRGARIFLISLNISLALALLILWALDKKSKNIFFQNLIRAFRVSVIATVISLAVLIALYFIDFDWAFRKFHEIFFTNDLWLLDPRTDRLIQLMPLEFFINFTSRWLRFVSLIFAGFVFLGFILPRYNKRQNALRQ